MVARWCSCARACPSGSLLEEQGVPTTIVRIPANFPPSGTASRELSGMGTPDLLGGNGTYSLFTTAPERLGGSPGGDVQRAEIRRGVFNGSLRGPPNPLLVELEELRSEFTAYLDPVRPVVKIEIGDEEIILQEGDWSDWVPVEYPLPLFQKLRGMTRFYLKQVRPEFQLYATPVNLDPVDPAMPILTPDDFAAELAEGGRFYTQGFPEDTDAISDGVFDEDEFLAQAALAAGEIRRQYIALLEEFEDGLLFNYFGFLDQVSHIMWGATDPEHPAYDEARDGPYAQVIEDLYMEADEIVGETLDRLEEMGGSGTLIVMSDHRFTSWRRAFSLNSWLEQNGYLTVRDRNRRDLGFLQNVDWSRTQAYALGLSGLYVNLEGREAFGIVPTSERGVLLREITRGLLREVDSGHRRSGDHSSVCSRRNVYGLRSRRDGSGSRHRVREGCEELQRVGGGRDPGRGSHGQHRGLEWRPHHGPRGGARCARVEPAPKGDRRSSEGTRRRGPCGIRRRRLSAKLAKLEEET